MAKSSTTRQNVTGRVTWRKRPGVLGAFTYPCVARCLTRRLLAKMPACGSRNPFYWDAHVFGALHGCA
eukprot:scaffold6575_cov45-Attheya_sp.AAC.1